MGIRTPGLVIANDALYQLSYTPDFAGVMLTAPHRFSRPPERRDSKCVQEPGDIAPDLTRCANKKLTVAAKKPEGGASFLLEPD
jgi:hypothetical protein